jgi:hypothetical protein
MGGQTHQKLPAKTANIKANSAREMRVQIRVGTRTWVSLCGMLERRIGRNSERVLARETSV